MFPFRGVDFIDFDSLLDVSYIRLFMISRRATYSTRCSTSSSAWFARQRGASLTRRSFLR